MTPIRSLSRAIPLAVILAAATLVGAQVPASAGSFERIAPRDSSRTLDALLPNAASHFDVRDKAAAPALTGRLEEIEREIKLWETVRTYARQGRLVELSDLRASRFRDATAADLPAERLKTEAAKRALAERELGAEAARRAAPPLPEPKVPTAHGAALLDVVVEAPAPPKPTAANTTMRAVADPAGLSKALYEAGDLSGALEALTMVPEAQMTPEARYRKARALDKMRRPAEARQAYAAVVAADADGFYGRQAKWMLDLAGKVESASAVKPAAGEKQQ